MKSNNKRERARQKSKTRPPKFVSVALIKFADKPAVQLAFKILETAGILYEGEGGLGMIEICVPFDQAGLASDLLNQEPKLKGKFFSLDDLRAPRKTN